MKISCNKLCTDCGTPNPKWVFLSSYFDLYQVLWSTSKPWCSYNKGLWWNVWWWWCGGMYGAVGAVIFFV
uniref:Uncharacterized protein n=1 Tax=Cannabis sativa TaxID=3483 RepID=A0A803R020_CANSA